MGLTWYVWASYGAKTGVLLLLGLGLGLALITSAFSLWGAKVLQVFGLHPESWAFWQQKANATSLAATVAVRAREPGSDRRHLLRRFLSVAPGSLADETTTWGNCS
ncbi:hypothetical protein [Amycolatopsis sp. cmx-8-4]|uniref:hypothetical protein n=1 Tax=Amycolatopsis sp. cmx-8-4 TaxID=2790947 RepID=UPI00397C0347